MYSLDLITLLRSVRTALGRGPFLAIFFSLCCSMVAAQALPDGQAQADSAEGATNSVDANKDLTDADANVPASRPLGPALLASDATSKERNLEFDQLAELVSGLETYNRALQKVSQLVGPSVVHIQAVKSFESSLGDSHYHDGHQLPVEEVGSGTIVRAGDSFYVLTNRHVVRDAPVTDIRIELWDGRSIYPLKMFDDDSTDVALLAIEAENLVPARLGDSSKLVVGEMVLAFGSPFGLNHSVTMGIVSAKSRRDLHLGDEDLRIQDFIQTDAAINPGNSGGPLMNLRGEVIAVNTAIAGNSGGNDGIAFAIPINLAKIVARRLVRHGQLPRPYLGVRLARDFGGHDTHRADRCRFCGTKVKSVTTDSPADQAGLQSGDIILRYNGVCVEDDSHFVNLVGLSPIGTDAIMTVHRDGEEVDLPIAIVEKDSSTARVARRE